MVAPIGITHTNAWLSSTDFMAEYLPKSDPAENSEGSIWSHISGDTKDIEQMARAAADPELIMPSDWSQFTPGPYWQANVGSGFLVFILANGKGGVYCPSREFLIEETQPGSKGSAFPPGVHVTDKGCFPFTQAIEGYWVNLSHPEKVPYHPQSGCLPATGSNATIDVDPADGWVSLNFIGAMSWKQVLPSIDEHPMWLYEVDGNRVEPQKFVSAAISSGERFSVMVKLDKPPGKYTIRLPDTGSTQVISGFADLIYKGANSGRLSEPYVTYGGLNATALSAEDSYTPYIPQADNAVPYPPATPRTSPPDEQHLLVMGRLNSSYKYTMTTNYLYPIDFSAQHPLLYYPNETLNGPDKNLVIHTKNGSWVDLILQVSTVQGDLAAFTHVMHKHGSKTWRIGHGQGVWNYSSVAEAMAARPEAFNLKNPGYRDTWLTDFSPAPVGGWWTVLRYQVTNPGPFLFHCHIELHAMGGMAIAILDGLDAWPQIPPEYQLKSQGHK